MAIFIDCIYKIFQIPGKDKIVFTLEICVFTKRQQQSNSTRTVQNIFSQLLYTTLVDL